MENRYQAIVAVSKNGVIGDNNKLLWHIKDDLQHFKAITQGKIMVMGRKTFESIGKPLPNRHTIILTRDKTYKYDHTNVTVLYDHNGIDAVGERLGLPIIVCGGSQIYELLADKIDEFYVTTVEFDYYGDARFYFDFGDWERLVVKQPTINNGVLICTYNKFERI